MMSGPSPPANFVQNSINSTPSTLSTPSINPPSNLRTRSRDILQSTNSRRRISIQTETASLADETAVASSHEEEDEEEIAFNALVQELEDLDIGEADGGDSDEEGTEVELFEESYMKAMLERVSHGDVDMHVQEINNGDIAYVIAKKGVITEDDSNVDLLAKVSGTPEEWEVPQKKDSNGNEPDFDKLDNPGKWSSFIFRPVYKKVGIGKDAKYTYLKHELPTGCTPVPLNDNGKRIYKGWEFFYNGWKSSKFENMRDEATADNLFPKERASLLDREVLESLGMNSRRIVNDDSLPDALFFYQLLLPMCDPAHSGIPEDPRKPYYTDVTKFSNLYKHQTGIGSTYGHSINEVAMPEYVRFDGCLLRDGVRGGGEGAIYRRWNQNCSHSDAIMQDSLSLNRWYQLKRIFKLNNNDKARKRGEEGYDPSYKYDMIYRTITENVLAITKNGELDLTGDETTWGFQGFGEKDAKVVFRVAGKPGVSKGGQTVIVCATNRIRPYWYQHRHSMNKRYGKGFTAEGPAEVRTCIDDLSKHVVGANNEKKAIFKKCPHITWDNYFSGEDICHYAGKKGFGLLMTNRRDRLPKEVKGEYMHKKKTDSTKRSKSARYIEPVILVKEEENYEVVLTTFQSTSSCNIISVNSINFNHNFVEARCRGRKQHKRHYLIEQNNARHLYLKSYSRIDSMDHLIKNCNIKYRTWKYWHAAANHAKSLAVVTSYDIYLELCEGIVNTEWKNENPVDFYTFRDRLSVQLCQYDPVKQQYPGDQNMRAVSKMTKTLRQKRRYDDDIVLKYSSDGTDRISFDQFKKLVKTKRTCTDLQKFAKHICSITMHKSPAKCAVCGINTYKKCSICNVPIHNNETRGIAKGKQCSMFWHDETYLGLCFDDRKLLCIPAKDWKPWSDSKLKEHKRIVKGYKRSLNMK